VNQEQLQADQADRDSKFREVVGRAHAILSEAFGLPGVQQCGRAGEVTRLRAELESLTRYLSAANDRVDELRSERDSLREANAMTCEEINGLREQVAKLRAEREPVDNGDGTVTQWRPVTFEAKLSGRVVAVRKPTEGESYLDTFGKEGPANGREHGVRLILSPPEPKPEPVTWRCELPDGEWTARSHDVTRGLLSLSYEFAGLTIRRFAQPPRQGRYLFRDGVGTLQGEAT